MRAPPDRDREWPLAIRGVEVGHWTGGGTGVTVVLAPEGTVGSGEIRGGAPATREFALLDPTRMAQHVDAVVLAGGSAFGLAAADGVVGFLAERGRGFRTRAGPVPVVVGACLFDLRFAERRPGPAEGLHAARAATTTSRLARGRVGAGAGATTGKWRRELRAGGLGWVTETRDGCTVAAVAVANAWGDVVGPGGEVLPGRLAHSVDAPGGPGENTTLAVVITDAALTKTECFLVAQSGQDGFNLALWPAHSCHDGDAAVALATGAIPADLDVVRTMACSAVARAIRAAVQEDDVR